MKVLHPIAPAHPAGRRRAGWRPFLLLWTLPLSSCDRPADPASPATPAAARTTDYRTATDEFSVMTYNLLHYSMEDRDEDGQANDPKPAEERQAVATLIAREQPDILAVQEIGMPDIFEEFQENLKQAGLTYEFVEYLHRDGSENNLAVLSRRPIISAQSHLDDEYTIGPERLPVQRGFIDVDIGVNPAYQFRLLVAHLKSKIFHEMGQTEMRRNEARLLNKHVRNALKSNPRQNILVAGDLNDTPNSAALNEVRGVDPQYLFDLRPVDFAGDVWTHFSRYNDEYSRIDYILVSEGMRPEVVPEKTRVVRNPLTFAASDHRPVVAVFKARDLAAPGAMEDGGPGPVAEVP